MRELRADLAAEEAPKKKRHSSKPLNQEPSRRSSRLSDMRSDQEAYLSSPVSSGTDSASQSNSVTTFDSVLDIDSVLVPSSVVYSDSVVACDSVIESDFVSDTVSVTESGVVSESGDAMELEYGTAASQSGIRNQLDDVRSVEKVKFGCIPCDISFR